MKRKAVPAEPVIDKSILEAAKLAAQAEHLKIQKCTVCGSACAPTSVEQLCWVCRRLKISAWRDMDQQAVQE